MYGNSQPHILKNAVIIVILTLLGFCILLVRCSRPAVSWPERVEQALQQAGQNRTELEQALKHFRELGDEQKLQAAYFLIENMSDQGFIEASFYTETKEEVPFHALDYGSFEEALLAMDQLEQTHGTLDYGRKEYIPDLEVMTARYFIENIELAFAAWRTHPWSRGISFQDFCEYILPYRCSNEPLGAWRPFMADYFKDLAQTVADPNDMKAVAAEIEREVNNWITFDEVYYLHPTDQSFEEMMEHKKGRCEDISTLQIYALRANGLAVASDYTPAWANRDNNHAWTVYLDERGHGQAPLSNVAAKIYRKTYSVQHSNPVFLKGEDEQIPSWLRGEHYRDVTEQYIPTSDIALTSLEKIPSGSHFVYLCVFNGGEWVPVASAQLEGQGARFQHMGRGIVYLPAYYIEDAIVPAGPVVILDENGAIRRLSGGEQTHDRISLSITRPDAHDADSQQLRTATTVKPGHTYEFFYWENDWQSLGHKTTTNDTLSFEHIPQNRLYWVIEVDGTKIERIFTIEDDRPRWW
ncbi:transglutaminase domain-containing protein [bacterium]|nr:transglutaminase domain-containing protein [bacterium]